MISVLPLTRHAEARSRQHGLDMATIDLLFTYGRRIHHAGWEI